MAGSISVISSTRHLFVWESTGTRCSCSRKRDTSAHGSFLEEIVLYGSRLVAMGHMNSEEDVRYSGIIAFGAFKTPLAAPFVVSVALFVRAFNVSIDSCRSVPKWTTESILYVR